MRTTPQVRGRYSRAISFTTPLEFVSGEGMELVTDGGERYLDFISGYGAAVTGHSHPRVVAALQAQAASLLHVSTVGNTPQAVAYSERLCAVAPIPNAKLVFGNSGAEAVEAALKLARYATGRPNVVAFAGGFHGRTLGALSVTSSKALFRGGHEPLATGVHFVPYPRRELAPTLAAISELFESQVAAKRVAAFIVEPVLGEGGYVVPPDGFLPALREVCDAAGILLIADEVQTGMGRTGRLFAIEHTGVTPDLMTVGKGIAAGFPMSALVGRAELMDAWEPGAHGTTFGGGPLACAVAAATLDVIDEDGLVANAARRGSELVARLRDVATRDVVDVRGRGLMIGVQTASPETASRLQQELLGRRVIVSLCGPDSSTIRLSPPLVVSADDIDRFVAAAADSLAALA